MSLSAVAALALVGMARLQLVRSRQTVSAVSLAWYAVELMRRRGRDGAPAEPIHL